MTSSKGPPFGPKERPRNYENWQKMMPWKRFCWFSICSQNVTFYITFGPFGLEKMTEKGRNWRPKAGFKIYGKSIEFNENVVFYSLSGVQQCSRMTKKWPKTCLFLLWQRRPKSLFGMLSGTPQNRHFFDLGTFWIAILLSKAPKIKKSQFWASSEGPINFTSKGSWDVNFELLRKVPHNYGKDVQSHFLGCFLGPPRIVIFLILGPFLYDSFCKNDQKYEKSRKWPSERDPNLVQKSVRKVTKIDQNKASNEILILFDMFLKQYVLRHFWAHGTQNKAKQRTKRWFPNIRKIDRIQRKRRIL